MTRAVLLLVVFLALAYCWEGQMETHHTCEHELHLAEAKKQPHFHKHTVQRYDDHPFETPHMQTRSLEEVQAFKRGIRLFFHVPGITGDDPYRCQSVGDSYQTSSDTADVSTWRGVCTEDDILTEEKRSTLLNDVLPWLAAKIQAMLKVTPVVGSLTTDRASCGSGLPAYAVIPDEHRSPGVEQADYIIYATARRHRTADGTIAWALRCDTDQFGRPTHGQINFNPSRIKTKASDIEQMRNVGLHEIFHAFGFSRGEMDNYRNATGGFYPDGAYTEETRSGSVIRKVTTPNVQIQVSSHFGCTEAEWTDGVLGAELEDSDQGFSHWEKRIFYNEIMTATVNTVMSLSPLTVALFQDMGWYAVDYFVSDDLLTWGKGEGCAFAYGDCATDWPDYYRCSETTVGCVPGDYYFRGECTFRNGQSIPTQYQRFPDPTAGGTDSYADYCPIYKAYANGDCRSKEGIDSSFIPTWIEDNIGLSKQKGEEYSDLLGQESRCHKSTLSPWGFSLISGVTNDSVGCYPTRCRNTVQIKIDTITGFGEQWRPCVGSIELNGYQGEVTCPNFCQFCDTDAADCNPSGAMYISSSVGLILLAAILSVSF